MLRDAYVAIADPTRRQILELLNSRGTTAAGDIAAAFSDLSRPAVSRHLRILRECDLVSVSRDGKAQKYSLNPEPISEIHAWALGFADRQAAGLRALRELAESDG